MSNKILLPLVFEAVFLANSSRFSRNTFHPCGGPASPSYIADNKPIIFSVFMQPFIILKHLTSYVY
jgi:hypothetical protein